MSWLTYLSLQPSENCRKYSEGKTIDPYHANNKDEVPFCYVAHTDNNMDLY